MKTLQNSGFIAPDQQAATAVLESWFRLWKQKHGASISGLIVLSDNNQIKFTPSIQHADIVDPQSATDRFEELLTEWRNNNPGSTPKSFSFLSDTNQISFAPSLKKRNVVDPDNTYAPL